MLSDLAANAAADAVAALLNGGTLCLYDRADTLLAELGFGAKAFGKAEGGVALARGLAPDTALANGAPAWYEARTARGQVVVSGTAGGPGSGAKLVLDVDELRKGAEVFCREFRYVQERA